MKVAILGYGVEGKSAAAYWQTAGHQITICDADPHCEVPSGVAAQTGPNYLHNLDQFDLIVRSPGIKPSAITQANPDLAIAKITTATNEFLSECPANVIGVTGTKGKGTTSTLISKILEAAGHRVHLGGNIGTAALDLLPQIEPEDWVVLELSSFQLMDARYSPHVAVMLMIAPDHQDWHPDMAEYLTAKQQIFAHQEQGDRAVFNACNLYSLQSGLGAPGDQLPYNDPAGAWTDGETVKVADTPICSVADIALPGRHNCDNVCAAVAATWPIIQDAAPIKEAIRAFTGLEHRLERVAEVNGVTYINDSYSTNPETSIAAIQAYKEPKVIILGGSSKGSSFSHLADTISHQNVRAAILIGETSPQIKQALEKVGYRNILLGTGDMESIVALTSKAAEAGDVVILSPACASFGLFKSYKDRGNQFRDAVNQLAQE